MEGPAGIGSRLWLGTNLVSLINFVPYLTNFLLYQRLCDEFFSRICVKKSENWTDLVIVQLIFMTMTKFEVPDYRQLRQRELSFRLFGLHLTHSRAPTFHNFMFNKLDLPWTYEIFESDHVPSFQDILSADNCIGSAVTMPNKVTMTQHVHHIDDGAKIVGAINTIYTRNDADNKSVIVGTNTDTLGIRDSFLLNHPHLLQDLTPKAGLVYGGGGACRSAVYALNEYLACDVVYIINRFADEVDQVKTSFQNNGFKGTIVHLATPEQAQAVDPPQLIVLTVPDFEPSTSHEKLAKQTLDVFIQSKQKGIVLEMCYHPNPITRLYREFEANDWTVISGVEAMIYQGIAQQVLWTGYTIDEMPIEEVRKHVYSTLK